MLVNERWHGDGGIGRFSDEVISRLGDHTTLKLRINNLHILDTLAQSFYLFSSSASVYFNPGYNPPFFSKVPFIFTIHDLNHLHLELGNSSLIKRLYYQLVMKRACQKAYKVLTVSEFSRQEILRWANLDPSKVVNVGNAAGKEFSPQGEKHKIDCPYILYVGNQKPHKNLVSLIKAFKESGVTSKVKLLITGKAEKDVEALIDTLSLDDCVQFTGYIETEKLPSYYRGAMACILPSLYEGFGLPIVESMASGTPVICSNTTACAEVAGGAAKLVNSLDIANIALGIREIVENESLRQSLAEKGIDRANDFSWEKTAKLVKQTITEAKNER